MHNVTCKVVSDLLPLYVDELVSPETKQFIEEHLTSCQACRETLKGMRSQLTPPEVPQESVEKGDAMATNFARRLKRKVRTLWIGVMIAIVASMLGAHYGTLLYSESRGNPLPYMWAVIKLELTDADLLPVTPDSTVLIQECCPQPLSKPLTDFMATRGWNYKDQMGAGILYDKGNSQLIVTSSMFSRRYVVYRLNRTP